MHLDGTTASRKRAPRINPIERICEQCSTTFTTWPHVIANGEGRLCSETCRLTALRRAPRACEQCGLNFAPYSAKARFCGRTCRDNARKIPVEERFWPNVIKTETCWLWTGGMDGHGYGRVQFNGKLFGAHQVAWILTNGPIPPGMGVRHVVCDNPPYVRPDHLSPGTQADNMADRQAKQRQPRGSAHGMSKLTESTVRLIRTHLAQGEPRRSIAARFGVSPSQISRIATGAQWQHVV
jgi:hypothetical protein